ncbi:DUF3857 domain-containing protein [Neptunitalea lumnitzerae]|uniref:DUF3857 domain-containing protein n=1 Tax=Neptunitalea lumnitzerae TaxID=2965509 RepID=A0ABQ5MI26_9FLAO|nr:DUF3857 domain-containing protein [Neptunitalea sp. Y10]GLB49065.1 hypothetical protein Y10_14330 [Neptunitalea sp. Y10]
MNKILIALTFWGLFSITATSQDFSVASIPQELLENADAVVRLDERNITVEDIKTKVTTITKVVTVLNKSGKGYVRNYMGYDPNTKIKKLDVRILDANGNEIERFKEKDFNDVSAVDGGTLYADSRVKYFRYTSASYPYTVVFTSEVEDVNTAFLPTWQPIYANYVGVEKSIYTIHAPVQLGLKIKEGNLEGYNIEKKAFTSGYQFSVTNIPAIKPEAYSPPSEFLFPYVMFALNKFHLEGVDGQANDWKSFGEWMYDVLLKDTYDLPESTKQKMKDLVADKPTTYEKAKAIYEYVQQNTRYISIQIGIGGWKPMLASEVDKLGYGDCKALTNYTKSLMNAAGLEANYSVVYAGANYKRDLKEDFVSVQGNHIILEIPTEEKDIWVDCTNQISPFNFIGDFTDDRKVLVVKPEGSEIVTTPAFLDDYNKQITTASCVLDANGNLSAEVSIASTGIQYDNSYYLELRSSEDQVKHYKRYWGNLNNLQVDTIELVNDKDNVEFTENVSVQVPNYLSFTGDSGLLVANFFNASISTPERYRNRTTPFYISRGFADEDTYTITLPDNFTVDFIPEPVKETHEYGTYEMSITKKGKQLVYHRVMKLNHGTYSKEKYSEFRKFFRNVSKMDGAKVIIKKTNQ